MKIALFQVLNSLVDTLTQNAQWILLRTASCSPKREGSKLDSHSSVCCYRIASPWWFSTMMCMMATVVNASVSIAFNEPDILGAELCLGLLQHFWEMLEGGEGRTTGALETMGLGHLAQEQAVVLSMGQRKRLQLARMLAVPRPLWLLDEPSVGLDAEGVEILEELIAQHRHQGGIVLVATHVPINLPDALALRLPPRVPQFRQYTAADYA
ncbi:hypothetical protein BDL97_01G008800 [Sphagnum fallax]|nr:hypothetical protein BDL97_01G008800 [Sphagnum fallax]